jgi:phosphoenolpyruvate synthase/pyruvate phosphate dikinase
MRVGRRLVREMVIEAPDDVFYLGRTEVADLLRTPSDVRRLVTDRRVLHARQRQITPAPIVGTPRGDAAAGEQQEASHPESGEIESLRGTGASPGVVRGTARVVHGADEFGRIMPGDIIICPASNPSWVPVFSIAGGLVTDRGGVLSHAAVVAREFGLPAVVGVRGATEVIADGQQVEIDGTSGVVRLL